MEVAKEVANGQQKGVERMNIRIPWPALAMLALISGPSAAMGQWPPVEGVTLEVAYTADALSNVSGGVRRGFAYLDNLDVALTIDAEKVIGWKGATLFVYTLGNQGGSPSDLTGDLQTLSNLDAPDTWKLYEAWVDQALLGGKLSLRAGLYDLNSEFDAVETAGLFLNCSHAIGPDYSQTGQNGPSIFPATSLALRVRFQPSESFLVQGVVLDAVPGDPHEPLGTQVILNSGDGALFGGELGLFASTPLGPGRFSVGGYWYTGTFDGVFEKAADGSPMQLGGNRGLYFIAEQSVHGEPSVDEQRLGLSTFLRVGVANGRLNQLSSYVGGGMTYTGLFSGREADQIGLAFARARNGDDFLRASLADGTEVDRSETSIELTYNLSVSEWFSIQPEIQYIINPGTDPLLKNALVLGLRTSIVF
jgi:porin